jgi:hypothetical protein
MLAAAPIRGGIEGLPTMKIASNKAAEPDNETHRQSAARARHGHRRHARQGASTSNAGAHAVPAAPRSEQRRDSSATARIGIRLGPRVFSPP